MIEIINMRSNLIYQIQFFIVNDSYDLWLLFRVMISIVEVKTCDKAV